jgi:16S rRNA processing protein RimM
MNKDDAFFLGRMAKTHGLKGDLSATFDNYNPEDYITTKTLFLEIGNALVPYFIEKFRSHQNKGFIKFEEVDSIEEAKKLMQASIYVPKSELPELDEEEFYFHELIGFQVTDTELGELGEVIEVYDFKNHSVLSVDYKGKEVMIPMHEDVMQETDFDKKEVIVQTPEGLLDVYMEED